MSSAKQEYPLPPAFLARMQHLMGDEFSAFRASLDRAPSEGLRVNTLKLSVPDFEARSPFDLAPLPSARDGFLLAPDSGAGRHPYHAAGLYYLQDPSAMAVVELMNPRPGDRVLDLAAAPGGKATHIAARLQNQGLLVANEIHNRRVWDLASNLERWGAQNAIITNETPERLSDHFGSYFDHVLLDAPCSAEGMFRKFPAARREWGPDQIGACARRQSAILERAALLVRPGGTLTYATCTFAPEENEAVIARFLQGRPEFALIATEPRPGMEPGRPVWVGHPHNLEALNRTVRIWPHQGPGEGHFIARMKKDRARLASTALPRRPPATLPAEARGSYRAFSDAALEDGPDSDALALIGSYIYAMPVPELDTGALRVIHPGWWLGKLQKGRFEPSHALALALTVDQSPEALNLDADSAELQDYLRGLTLKSPGRDGWILMAVDGFGIGWAKRVQNQLKNHYPRGLRLAA